MENRTKADVIVESVGNSFVYAIAVMGVLRFGCFLYGTRLAVESAGSLYLANFALISIVTVTVGLLQLKRERSLSVETPSVCN